MSLTQAQERFPGELLNLLLWVNGDNSLGPSPKSLGARQRSLGTASSTQLAGPSLAASGILCEHETEMFPAISFTRPTPPAVNGWLLERPQASEVVEVQIHIV